MELSAALRSRKTVRILVLTAAASGIGFWAWSHYRLRPPERPLRIAVTHSPPFAYLYANGSVGGFAVEVLAEAARRRGFAVEWVPSPPDPETLLPAGKVDLWAALSITPERRRYFYFSLPYSQNEFCLISRAPAGSENAPRPIDTTGRTVAISSFPTRKAMVSKLLPNARTLRLDDRESVVQAVCDGRADYGFVDTRAAALAALQRPKDCESVNLALTQLPGATVPVGIGAAPQAVRYADALREEIGAMAADGSLAPLYGRWLVGSGGDIDEFLGLIDGARRETRLIGGVGLLSLLLGVLLWQVGRIRSARRAAETANKFKSQFLANMSHEMRTPLNGVIGMTSLLSETSLSVEQGEHVRTIQRAGEILLSLINDVLDFSKIEAGKLSIETTAFDPRILAADCMRLVEHEAGRKNLALGCEIGTRVPPQLQGDPVRIRQVLLNLLSNAVKFTSSGEVTLQVDLRSQAAGAAVIHFVVADSGIGIPREARSQLFRAFSQADASTTRRYGGTGLGLAISKRLVELMGGELGIEDKVRKGSTFWFTLPLQVCDKPAVTAEAINPAPTISIFHARVLLAEDNLVNQRVGMLLLQKLGCEVDVVSNGREAAEAANRTRYEAIFMDCQMPELDGYAATRAIRKGEGNGRRVPIIAMTANAVRGDRELCLACGMDDYLTKPILVKELQAALRRWLTVASVS